MQDKKESDMRHESNTVREPASGHPLTTVLVFSILYALIVMPAACAGQANGADTTLRPYQKVSGVSGTINSIGSDTLNNLITLWAEGIPEAISQCENSSRGEGVQHGAACAH
jgi:phosphate transport system substrate-binding protein